jgi:hypothetical protein
MSDQGKQFLSRASIVTRMGPPSMNALITLSLLASPLKILGVHVDIFFPLG